MSVKYNQDMTIATMELPNHPPIVYYKKGEVYFHEDTSQNVAAHLLTAMDQKFLTRVYYGDAKTGRDWMEENDVLGIIGRSMGTMKVPLLVKLRAYGGPPLLDHCIVRMEMKIRSEWIEVYRHPLYHQPTMTIEPIPTDEAEKLNRQFWKRYQPNNKFQVMFDGQTHARFQSLAKAEKFVKKMKGYTTR